MKLHTYYMFIHFKIAVALLDVLVTVVLSSLLIYVNKYLTTHFTAVITHEYILTCSLAGLVASYLTECDS